MNSWPWRMVVTTALGLASSACSGNDHGGYANPLSTSLAKDEAGGVLYLREEEKLAHDVYTALDARDPLFATIAESESRHMDAVLGLIENHGLSDPAANLAVGQFANPALQSLHDTLVESGSASTEAALTVGAEIEELDLADLDRFRATSTQPDVLRVFGNLARGSRNHLRHFDAALAARGVKYTARHLDQPTYDQIASSPIERGGRWR